MAAVCTYWNDRFHKETGMYTCPGCQRDLKPKMSQSAKNPGRTFASCSRDYGGCGLFSFIDEQPKFMPQVAQGAKRAREEGGNNVIGPIVNRPDVTETRLAELATKIDEATTVLGSLRSEIAFIASYVKQLQEN